ncbi:cytochrome c-type biogenesis protein CcmH [Pasteurellaceae bacterium TAE3-ERU1]|nr:cytochrome c-type biogenesis protein CcmH [Pasteurellaceae bacterium TAE3-ERU1]
MSKIIAAALLLFAVQANGAIDALQFSSPAQEEAYHQLTEQLRCPQCQNNSIADSNATIANDMRAKVFELLEQGKSKQEIVDYMVARYGHFVTYDPPLTLSTVLLWLLPVVLLLIGLGLFFKRRPHSDERSLDRQRLDALLRNDEEQQ